MLLAGAVVELRGDLSSCVAEGELFGGVEGFEDDAADFLGVSGRRLDEVGLSEPVRIA